MSAENNRKEENKRDKEKMILNEVFKLDFHEFVDEYTDEVSGKASGKTPDFYLRSKEEGLPDLVIEVKKLQRDYYRILEENSLGKTLKKIDSEIAEHSLSISNLHISVGIPPIKVKETWDSLKE